MMRPRRDEICASWSRGGALVTLRALVLVLPTAEAVRKSCSCAGPTSESRVVCAHAPDGQKCEFAGCCKQMMWKDVV